jgi:Flp pilus assembly protein TadG
MLNMRLRKRLFGRREKGQSLIETAIMLPLILAMACNAINLAYFWYMVLTLSAIPRLGAQFATQGGQALAASSPTQPTSANISDMVYENLLHTIGGNTVNTSVRVCTTKLGKDATTKIANCQSYGPSPTTPFPANVADPEPAYFTLVRVDVAYQVTPLIPGSVFNVILPSNMTFYRHVTMRDLY